MDTLLKAIDIVLETHFRFGFPNESPVGVSLSGGDSGRMPFEASSKKKLQIFLIPRHNKS
jgi:hypothetical protein